MTVYAIGDIHGQLGMLEAALERIEQDGGSDAQIVFLGDLVDRGPDSRGVIDLLSKGGAAGRSWTVLLGNHDRRYHSLLSSEPKLETRLLTGPDWFHDRIGGKNTLASYGMTLRDGQSFFHVKDEAQDAVPQEHIDFMGALPSHHLVDDLLFVHAGVRPKVPLAEQIEDDLIWIRDPFLKYKKPHPWLVVHGHTPVDTAENKGNRVNLDSGAGYGRPMTAAVFEGRLCWELTSAGRKPLLPS